MADATSSVPNPGTVEAQMRGCTCPVIDNGHGKGYRGLPGCFVYTAGCQLHCPAGADIGPFRAVEVP